MSTKLMSFFIPNRISPKIAVSISHILSTDFKKNMPILCVDVEIYMTTAILYNSWCQSDASTIKGLLNTVLTLNKYENPISLAEKIYQHKDIFRDPNSGNLSVEMMEVQSMLLYCLSLLAKSHNNYHDIKNATWGALYQS